MKLKVRKTTQAFTLIEVLLALAVIAIALTALVKATAQDVAHTQRLKEKMITQWISTQGAAMVQLGLLSVTTTQEVTQITTMFGQRWYWRVKLVQTPIKSLQQLIITTSKNQAGPFTDPVIAFRYRHAS
ncbi:type II secretory pathway protein LspI [Legionella quinlivanii]|uniref:Type II secretion system protein I n=1 Tax=Legionella quinlivanii TaxID=45073 RepID=A0A0W0Y4F9_9GAMM|nr:GspI family T2SS minor pseudopilin variant LspI [Legionella quinlivanii]KTD51567.1 type II secretory pathway protein LspI [Legionella quinlivanii]MCW8450905.1 GspI family T2SS minor pseudopilin variant LspI [Legionella quinlivanii]SEF59268.1 general secretion pathway protein I [Legionella quinlivanii DSM 21216]STY10906.1 general secretion pathway protein I [Legionella quinlivanii]